MLESYCSLSICLIVSFGLFEVVCAGLTIVANVAITTGPALLGDPRTLCEICSLKMYEKVDIRI